MKREPDVKPLLLTTPATTPATTRTVPATSYTSASELSNEQVANILMLNGMTYLDCKITVPLLKQQG
jgi:hypothetical protein